MEIDEEYIDKVQGLIEQKDTESVKALLADLHPADIAELCNDLDVEEARFIYRLLDNETAADVLVEMDEDSRKDLLEALPSETIAKKFVDYMDTDDAVDLMRELDEDKQEEVLSHIEDIEQAGDIVDLLKYDEDTAGGLMGTEMVTVNENWSMPECLKEMRQQAEDLDEISYVYVIDDEDRLQGVFPLKKMITSPSVSKVKHVMTASDAWWDKSPWMTSWTRCANSRSVTTSWHPVCRRTWRRTTTWCARHRHACRGCSSACWAASATP